MYINVGSFDEAVNRVPAYLIGYLSFDLMELAQARSYVRLLEVLENTPYYKVLKPLLAEEGQGIEIYERCGIALYKYYYRWVLKAVDKEYKGRTARDLKELFLRQADLDNILTAYRMKHFFAAADSAVIRAMKPFHYRLTEIRLAGVLSAAEPDKELIKLLESVYFKGGIEYDENSLEAAVRQYNYHRHFKRRLALSRSGAMSLAALMNLLEAERFNLQEIIE